MNKKELDSINIKILQNLQENCREFNVELSKKVNLSPSNCLRRIASLEKAGFINGYHADLNPALLNMNVLVFVNIRAEFNNNEERLAFEKGLSNLPEVRNIFALATDTDFLCKIVAPSYHAYKLFVKEQLSKIPHIKQVKSTHVSRIIQNKHGIPIKKGNIEIKE